MAQPLPRTPTPNSDGDRSFYHNGIHIENDKGTKEPQSNHPNDIQGIDPDHHHGNYQNYHQGNYEEDESSYSQVAQMRNSQHWRPYRGNGAQNHPRGNRVHPSIRRGNNNHGAVSYQRDNQNLDNNRHPRGHWDSHPDIHSLNLRQKQSMCLFVFLIVSVMLICMF